MIGIRHFDRNFLYIGGAFQNGAKIFKRVENDLFLAFDGRPENIGIKI